MKRFLSSILISFVIFANLFAPFSIGINGEKVEINKNEVRAEYSYELKVTPTLGDEYIKLGIEILEKSDTGDASLQGVISSNANLQVKATLLKDNEDTGLGDLVYLAKQEKTATLEIESGIFTKIKPETPYKTKIELIERITTQTSTGAAGSSGVDTFKTLYETTIDTPTTKMDASEVVQQEINISGDSNSIQKPDPKKNSMPACDLFFGKGTPMGCVAQGFYYILFVPTSYLFALSGVFFDNTFAYSVQDTSYRSTFVVEGWGLVRDFCNMFFIFILLYVAIGTILDLHGFKTKDIIKNVIIIGLVINFSLFVTQVIIDASNITARVFYNADTIKITDGDANGVANATPGLVIGEDGVIPLSAALVNKVNPQNIIINSEKINDYTVRDANSTVTSGTEEDISNMNAGTFILIVLLAVAVNVVGIIVFLSVGLIFISRVVGLWVAMIIAPLAFFTYIIPSMKGIKMIGWSNWLSETLKLAFLAPVFMFFMYIILKFLELDLISDPINKTGLDFFIATIIPFAFIMILMMKAKGIAKDMSGELGQQITGGVAAAGGMLLGGAALGGAFLGRKTIGSFMKGASTGESANQRFARGASLNRWDKIKGAVAHYGTFGGLTAAQKAVGEKLNKNQHEISHATHSRSELDTVAGTIAHGKKWDELNGNERYEARRKLERDRVIRENSGSTAAAAGTAGHVPGLTTGLGTRKWDALTTAERDLIDAAIGVQTAGAHKGQAVAGSDLDRGRTVTDTGIIRDARRKVGLGESIIQSTIGGSFDIRDLSKLVVGEQDRTLNKFATGLTSALASGMRNTIKQTGINYGEGQKDFIKDLGHTITESLKSTKVKVDLSHVGQEHKEDAHGGGGGHH